jgi:hypothetical protein
MKPMQEVTPDKILESAARMGQIPQQCSLETIHMMVVGR